MLHLCRHLEHRIPCGGHGSDYDVAKPVTHLLRWVRDESEAIRVVCHGNTRRCNRRCSAVVIETTEIRRIEFTEREVDSETWDVEFTQRIIVGEPGAHGHVRKTCWTVLVVIMVPPIESERVAQSCL